ncbi:putative SP-containing protein [Vairimorpha necatrix]|uniref:SP-containing protein n=1 Tax=Vairimorpha necatrix TaxID=6039 RepID=A0AAX4J9D5_9MICR
MLQNILFVISFALGSNSSNFWRGWEDQPKHGIYKLKKDDKKNNENNLKVLNERQHPYKRLNAVANNATNEKMQTKEIHLVQRFVNNMVLYNSQNNNISKNYENYIRRSIYFDSLIQEWENAKIDPIKGSKELKFNDTNYKKFTLLKVYTNAWLFKFKKISIEYLPKIRTEIQNSSINETYKKFIIENIDCLSRVMKYYTSLVPFYKSYRYESKNLIYYYTLLSLRLPYLFTHFDVCGKFIRLYENIIAQLPLKLDNTSSMTTTLLDLGEKISYIIYARDTFLEKIKEMTNLLRNLK